MRIISPAWAGSPPGTRLLYASFWESSGWQYNLGKVPRAEVNLDSIKLITNYSKFIASSWHAICERMKLKIWSNLSKFLAHSELIKFPSDDTIRERQAKKHAGSYLSIHILQRHISPPARNDFDVGHVFAGKQMLLTQGQAVIYLTWWLHTTVFPGASQHMSYQWVTMAEKTMESILYGLIIREGDLQWCHWEKQRNT